MGTMETHSVASVCNNNPDDGIVGICMLPNGGKRIKITTYISSAQSRNVTVRCECLSLASNLKQIVEYDVTVGKLLSFDIPDAPTAVILKFYVTPGAQIFDVCVGVTYDVGKLQRYYK